MKKYSLLIVTLIFFFNHSNAQDVLWHATAKATPVIQPGTLYVLSDGSSLVYGKYQGAIDFQNESDDFNFTALGSNDYFICKYDPLGNLVFSGAIGGELSSFNVNDVAEDSNGNLYFCGSQFNELDFDPDPNVENIVDGNGGTSPFLFKLNSDGEFQWVNTPQSSLLTIFTSIEIREDDSIFLCGYYNAGCDFDPDNPGGDHVITDPDAFGHSVIVRYNTDGNYQSSFSTHGAGQVSFTDLDIDPNGDLIASGSVLYNVDLQDGPEDFIIETDGDQKLICKYTDEGELVWGHHLFVHSGFWSTPKQKLEVNSDGSFFFAGNFYGTEDLDFGSGEYIIGNDSQNDVFVAKFNSNAEIIWAKEFNTNTENSIISSLQTDENEFPYITTYATSISIETNNDPWTFEGNRLFLKFDGSGNPSAFIGYEGYEPIVNDFAVFDSDHFMILGSVNSQADIDFTQEELIVEPVDSISNIMVLIQYSGLVVSMEEIANNGQVVNYYPNPCTNQFTLEGNFNEISAIEAFDQLGRSYELEVGTGGTVEVSHLTSGIYFVQATYIDGPVSFRIVVN